MSRLRRILPVVIAGALLALIPGSTFAAPDVLAPACSAGNGIITMILKLFSGLLPVIVGLGVLLAITQRERSGSVVGAAIAHITDLGLTGSLLVISIPIAGMLLAAISGVACP